MFRRWESLSIAYKLSLALIAGIGILITILLAYLWGFESKLMLHNEQRNLHVQSLSIGSDLSQNLQKLHKEAAFLAHLEVMEDIVIGDMDRRITRMLEQKAADLGESVSVSVVDTNGTIIATSEKGKIGSYFDAVLKMDEALKMRKHHFYAGQFLYLFEPIHGSFYTDDFLGYLLVSYPIDNLSLALKSHDGVERWLVPSPALNIEAIHEEIQASSQEYLYDASALHGILEGWTLHTAMSKKSALALLYHFQSVILGGFIVSLFLIVFMVWFIVLRIIDPLRELSDTAMTIALTGDYGRSVSERGDDEIGTLARSFNAMVYSTLLGMKHLEIERKNNSDKLVSLIGFFNAITRASSKEETHAVALDQIARLSHADSVVLEPAIALTNADIPIEGNERFYEALEGMIALQIERIELFQQTQSALEAKSAFLSAMSHELRTPLGSILSLSQYLMGRETDETLLETLGKIENSAYHLLGVINTILDLAKAESGKMEPHPRACNPSELIEGALELVRPLADEKGLKISVSYEICEGMFRSDPHLFNQVVLNLLSNAIKYTPSGSIEIVLHCHEGRYVLDITDTGRGIAAESLSKLFEEFYRSDAAEISSEAGSGLGLALAKKIAQILGGDLFIRSEGLGKGTVASFHFRSL